MTMSGNTVTEENENQSTPAEEGASGVVEENNGLAVENMGSSSRQAKPRGKGCFNRSCCANRSGKEDMSRGWNYEVKLATRIRW